VTGKSRRFPCRTTRHATGPSEKGFDLATQLGDGLFQQKGAFAGRLLENRAIEILDLSPTFRGHWLRGHGSILALFAAGRMLV
jgi:hypothetical protein